MLTTLTAILSSLDTRRQERSAQKLASLRGAPTDHRRILDAGCGTGLCGPLLRPFASHLTGVDLSPRMVEKAHDRGSYDTLEVTELSAFMATLFMAYDVIFYLYPD